MNEYGQNMFELPDVQLSENSGRTELERNLNPKLNQAHVNHTVEKTENGHVISITSEGKSIVNLTTYLLKIYKSDMGMVHHITVSQDCFCDTINVVIFTTNQTVEDIVSDEFATAAAEYESSIQFEKQDKLPTNIKFEPSLFAASSTAKFRPCGLHIMPAQSENSLLSAVCVFENMNVDSVNWC